LSHAANFVLVAVAVGITQAVVAQDSTRTSDSSHVSPFDFIHFEFSGAHYYSGAISQDVAVPAYLQTKYRAPIVASDSPLHHGASYLAIRATATAFPGVRLRGELIGESRGISYGVDNTSNMIVFPRFTFTIDTSISVSGEKIGAYLMVGDTTDIRFDQGLMFYNMDAQGTLIRVSWKSLRFNVEHVGDALFGIGLQINDSQIYGLSLADLPVYGAWSTTIRAGLTQQIDGPSSPFDNASPRGRKYNSVAPSNFVYSLSANLHDGRGDETYVQGGLRDSKNGSDVVALGALLAGVHSTGSAGRFEWDGRMEYRFYGGLFNAGYYRDDILYRNTASSYIGYLSQKESLRGFGNTIGPFLYPLQNMERPFSQWAVFTEYQDLKDIMGLAFQLRGKYFFYDRFLLRAFLDFNYIKPEQTDGFLYPFYDIGLGWEPAHNISIVISTTNRGMNLDKSYPTYYLYKSLGGGVTLRWNVP
jgi:hypothetical protein